MMALDLEKPDINMKRLFYPKWWLEATGYFEHKGQFGPDAILFAPSPTSSNSASASLSYYSGLILTSVISSIATAALVMYYFQQQGGGKVQMGAGMYVPRHEYTPINSNSEL